MTQNEIDKKLELHALYLKGDPKGEKADFRGVDLEGANLKEANLGGADFIRANLARADLYKARLCGANLEGANLEGANLEGADLRRANLEGADPYGTSIITFQLGKHSGFHHEGHVQIGCEGHSLEYWLEHYEEIGKKHGYSKKEIEKYRFILQSIATGYL